MNNDALYWRYKKKTPPQEEYPGMNGEVRIIKPAETIEE